MDRAKITYRTTTKGKRSLLLLNYEYYHKRDNASSTNWVCCHGTQCFASLTISSDNTITKINGMKIKDFEDSMVSDSHENHGPMTDIQLAVEAAVQNIRRRCIHFVDVHSFC